MAMTYAVCYPDPFWVQCNYATGATGNSVTWDAWNYFYSGASTVATGATGNVIYQWQVWNNAYQETTKQQRARITAEREAERVRLAEAAEHDKKAQARAEELLFLFLTPEQQKMYKEKGYFDTEVNDKQYRLYKGRAGNVRKIENGKEVDKLCAHPVPSLPDADNVLAQFLALHTDEAAFNQLANHTRLN